MRSSRARRIATALFLPLSIVVLAGCTSAEADQAAAGGAAAGGMPQIIATHGILADVAEEIAGGEAHVSTFIPVGADPHNFAPSTRDIASLHDADLIIENGLGLEAELETYVSTAAASGVSVLTVGDVVNARTVTELYGASDHDHDHDDEHSYEPDGDHDHDHGPYDAHFWHDVERMVLAVDAIEQALENLDGVDPAQVRVNADAYRADLKALGDEVVQTFETIDADRRVLVTQHRVLGYLAAAYGFDQVGSILPGVSTVAQATPADISALVQILNDRDIPAIFSDATQSDALAKTVQAETNEHIEIVPLFTESLTGADGEASSYVDLIRVNAQRIANALS